MRDKCRIDTPEMMDLGASAYTHDEYEECLQQLAQIGKLLGGNRATFAELGQFHPAPTSILDVGCGGGEFDFLLAERYPQAHILGVDIDAGAINHANHLLKQRLHLCGEGTLAFETLSSRDLPYPPRSFEIVIATLVCHHMDDEQLVSFFRQATSLARRAVIINDLHRHWAASLSFRCLSAFFFRNRLIRHDGLLSIRKGFQAKDWKELLARAGIAPERFKITWNWPFRWTLRIEVPCHA